MAKNKIERIDQEITKVREKIDKYQEKLKALEARQTEAEKSGDRPDGARPAYDTGSAERHAVRSAQFPAVWWMTTTNRRKQL